ncbi:rhodanese-like domain-containing protein [Moraxella oculi]|uniref:Rhodanese-like domain-containing protein n=1 Tax=Moraxella oculi TaxID=2940516 RepID=A0ABW8U8I7_9GAMM
MKKITLLASLLVAMTACAVPSAKPPVQPADVQEVKKAEGVWIDVRSAEEYAQGHLQGALNITNEQIADQIPSVAPNKNTPIHLYCRSGRRAEVVKNTLTKLGYVNVTNHGGYDDLLKKGFR